MKRVITLTLILVFCFLTLTGQVWADADSTSTMILKENSDTYKINSKEFKFEKPFSNQGVLMACLDPIAKALNLTLEKSTDNKTITLKYSGSVIVMYIGSKDAIVDGKKTTIPQAPVSINGNIMVPLRFVVENFGGEVSVDGKTQDITVTKETAGDNSIKDFSLLLKKTTKEIVGDSYYNWSMHLPKDVKITYRNFNGSYNIFNAVDNSYNFSLGIYDLGAGESFETLVASELQYANDYTLINQEKSKRNGIDYFKVAYKDSDYIYEERDFVKGNKVYELYLEIEDTEKYKDTKELAALLDSFIPEFKKDNKAEDLSDVTADGYRVYEDKKLKFSIKVPADWYDSGNDNKENLVTFTEPVKDSTTYSDTLTVSMYSVENGFTLDKWSEREAKYIKDEFSPDLVKILKSEDITISRTKAKKNIYSMKLKESSSYTYNLLILGKSYKYDIRYITSKPYDNKTIQDKINSLLGTFVFSEPEADEVGSLLDPDSIIKPNGVRQVESKDKSISCEVPIDWSKDSTTDENTISYSIADRTISVVFSSKKGVAVQEHLDNLEVDFEKSMATVGSSMNIERQTMADKGVLVVKNSTDMTKGELTYKIHYYIFSKDDTVYEVVMYIADIKASEKNKKILSDIWESLKLK